MIRATVVVLVLLAVPAAAYEWCGGWGGANVIVNLYPKPIAVFSAPAEYQLAEWNLGQGDTSRPFRLSNPAVDTIASGDGRNSAAFLDEAALQARYGLSFGDTVLAWTSSRSFGGCTQFVESDVIFNAGRSWNLGPGSDWFQAVALHEFGHVLGFRHADGHLAIMNTYAWGRIGGEALFLDDREAFRRYYERYIPIPAEVDLALYAKYHDGSRPQWATPPPPQIDAGSSFELEGFTVENLGTEAVSPVRVAFYLSRDATIEPSDTLLGGVQWSTLERFQYGRPAATVTIPSTQEGGTYFVGAMVDDARLHAESNEGNNAVTLGIYSDVPAAIVVRAVTTTTTSSTVPSTVLTTVPPTTSTTQPPCICQRGSHCVDAICVPDEIPTVAKRACHRACRPEIKVCRAACATRSCRKRCRRTIVRSCKQNGVCPLPEAP